MPNSESAEKMEEASVISFRALKGRGAGLA